MDTKHTNKFIIALSCVLVAGLAIYLFNYISLQSKYNQVIKDDSRNAGITANVHFDLYIIPSIVVFDLKDLAGTSSQADVMRVLLQFSASIKDSNFELVKLRFRGVDKYYLKGDYFKTLGQEYNTQNPVYTMRTFPENVYNPDGTRAFGTWEGGLLGVVGKQIEDFGTFNKNWYFDDLVKAYKNENK